MEQRANKQRTGLTDAGDTGEGYQGDFMDMRRRGPLPRDGRPYIDWVDGDRYYIVISLHKYNGVECRNCTRRGNVEHGWQLSGIEDVPVLVCTNIDGLKSTLGDPTKKQGYLSDTAHCQFAEYYDAILAEI